MKNKITEAWEKRSIKYKDKIEGVLPKSLPRYLNEYLDKWMYRIIKDNIQEARAIKILDLGCGYGRISEKILKDFPRANIVGVDVAKAYVDIYNKTLNPRAKALVGDIKNLKFKSQTFDVVIIVTTLMYVVEKNEQMKIFRKIRELLKKNGKIILIERNNIGYRVINLGGLIPLLRGKKFAEIESTSFTKEHMVELLAAQRFRLLSMKGLPFWTLLLPMEIFIGIMSTKALVKGLKIIRKLDSLFYWLLTPSLYISYIGVKDEAT